MFVVGFVHKPPFSMFLVAVFAIKISVIFSYWVVLANQFFASTSNVEYFMRWYVQLRLQT